MNNAQKVGKYTAALTPEQRRIFGRLITLPETYGAGAIREQFHCSRATAEVVATAIADYRMTPAERRAKAGQAAIETQERLKIEELRRLPDEVLYLVAVDSALSGTEDKKFATLAEAQKFARDPKNRSMFIEKHVIHGDRTFEVEHVEHTRHDKK